MSEVSKHVAFEYGFPIDILFNYNTEKFNYTDFIYDFECKLNDKLLTAKIHEDKNFIEVNKTMPIYDTYVFERLKRIWYLFDFDIITNEISTIKISYKVKNFSEDVLTNVSSFRKHRSKTFFYDFKPASYFGMGNVDTFDISLSINPNCKDISLEDFPFEIIDENHYYYQKNNTSFRDYPILAIQFFNANRTFLEDNACNTIEIKESNVFNQENLQKLVDYNLETGVFLKINQEITFIIPKDLRFNQFSLINGIFHDSLNQYSRIKKLLVIKKGIYPTADSIRKDTMEFNLNNQVDSQWVNLFTLSPIEFFSNDINSLTFEILETYPGISEEIYIPEWRFHHILDRNKLQILIRTKD